MAECATCGREFEAPTRGRPRKHCELCRPSRAAKPIRSHDATCLDGEPFTLEHFASWAAELVLDDGERWALEPFQTAFLADVFAGFRECWLLVPEGNGKTTLLAGLALYHCEFTDAAWVPVAASARDQAEIMYRQAEGFVARSPRLRGVFKCQDGYRRIRHLENGSRIQVFAADDRTGDGVIPTLALLDELHRHRDLRLYRTWRGKLGKRDGQLAIISTAGEPGGEFEETRERIRQMGEREHDGCFVRAAGGGVVLHEWAVPEDGDDADMQTVKAANPFSGVTIETLTEKFASPTMTLPHWRRFVCNLATRGDTAAIQEAEWFAARTDDVIPPGEPVWAGLDVAWKWDTTALVPLYMPSAEFRLFGPATILEPPRDGTSLDPYQVEKALLDLHRRNPITTLVMDTSKAEQLGEWARLELGCEVVDRQQTNPLAAIDYSRFTEALRSGWLKHTGDPGLTRHVLNAVARTLPYGDTRFDRPARSRAGSMQDRRVIDALTAASMVHSTATAAPTVEVAEPWAAGW
jgi:phage terminase large subunit-like protein